MNAPTRRADLAYGFASEQKNIETISRFLEPVKKTASTYAAMDYTNDASTLYVELKTRRIRHNQFPTTLIGRNKVDFCKKDPSKKYYFVYCYTDGLYYIEYNKELFDTFECDDYQRGERADCYDQAAPTVFIPVRHLKPVPL